MKYCTKDPRSPKMGHTLSTALNSLFINGLGEEGKGKCQNEHLPDFKGLRCVPKFGHVG